MLITEGDRDASVQLKNVTFVFPCVAELVSYMQIAFWSLLYIPKYGWTRLNAFNICQNWPARSAIRHIFMEPVWPNWESCLWGTWSPYLSRLSLTRSNPQLSRTDKFLLRTDWFFRSVLRIDKHLERTVDLSLVLIISSDLQHLRCPYG